MKDLPSEEELFANRMKDGSRPPMHSKELYEKHVVDGFGRPLPPQLQEKTPEQRTALQLKIAIEERRLRNYDRIEAAGNYLMDFGYELLEGDCPGSSGLSPSSNESRTADLQPQEHPPQADNNAEHPSAHETTSSSAGAPEDIGEGADATSAEAESDDSSESDYGDPFDKLRAGSPQPRGQSPTAKSPPGQSPAARSAVRGNILNLPRLPEQRQPKGKTITGGKAVNPDSPADTDAQLESTADAAEAIADKIANGAYTGPKRSRKVRNKELTAKDAPRMIYTGARLLASVVDKRAECALRLVELTQEQSLKEAFYWDRAHAVIAATLLHLDKEFEEVGFGSWMPFRFPDQWLMFCGLMRRVLAADGLIHGVDPEQYRRLLEETPYPQPAIKNIDERIKWWKTPQNWSTLWTNRGAETMEILKQRLKDEVWDPTTEFGGTRAPPDNPHW